MPTSAVYLPENFEPVGSDRDQTGRPGLRLLYDEYGVAHGQSRDDVAFGRAG
jgi:hypothetical protein